jgi:hypothetical protein
MLDVEQGLSYPEVVAWLGRFDSVEAALDAAPLNQPGPAEPDTRKEPS